MPKIENKTNHEKVIGRDPVCDFVILDPKCRVSRRHVLVKKLDTARFEVTDLNSSNGTHVNGRKIPPNSPVVVSQKDNITLSKDYLLDLGTLWKESRASGPNKNVSSALVTEPESQGEGTIIRVNHGDRNIQLDTNRTTIGELISVDKIGFVTVGRDSKNEIIINDSKVSREHCKLRLVSPYIFEIIDLGSTNGTFVDGIRIESGKNLIFKTQAKISLGDASKFLDLRKVFPEIQDFPQQEKKVPHPPNRSVPKDSKIASPEEMEEFKELEGIWKEYSKRQTMAPSLLGTYNLGGSAVTALVQLAFGPVGAVLGVGSQLVLRYLGQMKANKIQEDLTFEEAFLVSYACPRCKESFQKKPWVTIRDCGKCKTKYRL